MTRDAIGFLVVVVVVVLVVLDASWFGRGPRPSASVGQTVPAAPPLPENLAYEEHQRWLAGHGVKADRAREGQLTTWWDASSQPHEGVEYISDTLGTISREHKPDANGKYHWVQE